MKVLITGGLGQIGSFVAEALLERGDNVLVIDDLSTGRKEHLKEHSNLKVIIGSVADLILVNHLMGDYRPDVVIHAAASFKDPNDWYNDTLTNCVGSINIFKACMMYKINRIIYFQTSLCYGDNKSEKPSTLDTPLNPGRSSYSISKTTAEYYLFLSNLSFVSFRLANVIGPRNLAGPLPIFYKRLREGKKCFVANTKRDFISAKNLVPLVLKACDGTGNGVYNFSSGKDTSIETLYHEVVKVMKIETPVYTKMQVIGSDDVNKILIDPTKTIEDFGQYQIDNIQTIVVEAVDYYDQYPIDFEHTHLKILNSNSF